MGGDGIWFIPCLIVVEMVSVFILNYLNKPQWIISIAILFFLSSYLITDVEKHHLPWNVDTASFSICFFLVGYLVNNVEKPNFVLSSTFFIFYLITSQYLGQTLYCEVNVDLHNNVVGNPFVYIIFSIIASYALFTMCRHIPVFWYFRKLGQYTLFSFPFHPFAYRTISKIAPAWGGGIIAVFVIPTLTGFVLIVVCMFLERYAPYLIGKYKYIKRQEKVISNCSE